MSTVLDYKDSLNRARQLVAEYSGRDSLLMEQHRKAMECRDCEDFLDIGLSALRWLKQADLMLHQAAIRGADVPVEARDALATLYRAWLVPCPHADARIREHLERGYALRNLAEYQAARAEVEQQVRLLEMEDHLDSAFQGGVFDDTFWREAGDIQS